MTRMARWLGVAVLSACQFPRPADVPGDAGPDAPTDAPTDARPELVQGTLATTHQLGTNATDTPIDATQFTIQAFIPTGGSFATAAGVPGANGSFEVDNVAPGVEYILRLGRSAYVTDAHTITLRTVAPTRARVVAATQPTPVTFQIGSTVPFASGDSILALSRTADAAVFISTVAGQTSVSATLDWMAEATGWYGTAGGELPDPTAGDDQYLIQLRTTPATSAGARSVQQIVAASDIRATVLHDGQATSITSTLDIPAATFTMPGSILMAPYAAGHSAMTRPSYAGITCAALPGVAAGAGNDGGANLGQPIASLWHQRPVPTTLDSSGTFGDPFPQTWARYCQIEYRRSRELRAPGATTSLSVAAASERAATPPTLLLPPMAPPTAIRIRGQDGDRGGLLRNDGMPVAMTWTGAAQATQYNVTIYRLTIQGTSTIPRMLISVTTSKPMLTLPAELLAGSDFIFFVVNSVSSTNAYANGVLQPEGIPSNMASTVTAMFRWSATCGDSTPDIGEDCDAGGETTMCDADCTTAVCGDGTRNIAAGELCDSIVDTPGCDSDCTANTCGDGHLNAETEQCDDGGTTPGDGCSATCTTE